MSTIRDFGIPNVGNGILHPKHKDRWRVLFPSMGSGASSLDLSFQAVTVQRPKLKFDEVQLHRYNSRAWVAGKHDWDPCSVVVEDDVTSRATVIIQEQLQRQQLLVGAAGPWLAKAPQASDYKFAMRLEMLDGGENVIEQWDMEGCWLQQCDWDDLTYEDAAQVKISLTVRFDHARQTIIGSTGDGLATGGDSQVVSTT